MSKNLLEIKKPADELWGIKAPRKKRQVTNAQKIWCWDNNPHICNICLKRVTKISDAEFDHTRAHSKGGATGLKNVKISHRQCNRLKGTKTLSETRELLGIKTKKRKTTKKKPRKRRPESLYDMAFKLPKI